MGVKYMEFGQKLQKLRKEHNMSQEDLAQKIGVTRQSISKWELKNSFPETDKVILMSKLFGVSTDYLLLEDECRINNSNERQYTHKVKYVIENKSISKYKNKLSKLAKFGLILFIIGISLLTFILILTLFEQNQTTFWYAIIGRFNQTLYNNHKVEFFFALTATLLGGLIMIVENCGTANKNIQ